MNETVFDFVKSNESGFNKPISLDDGWNWSMKAHLRKCFLYKNSQFIKNNDDRKLRPFNNIILAIRNLQNRTEGFDVKDIELYVNDADEYYKSFFTRKFHDKWAPENFIDTFIDDVVDSYGDYGGIMARDTKNSRPEVMDLRSLAFCNQKNILAYPFCFKHTLSPSELREMGDKLGWGDEAKGANITTDQLVTLCKDEKEIVAYELHGILPKEWLSDEREGEKEDVQQIQVIAYYKRENGDEQGVTLFKNREPKLPFKFLARDKIVGRALGRSGIEELFDSQKWTNWDEIKITEMLEAASKIIMLTDDPTIAANHPSGMKNVENLELIKVNNQGKGVWQMDNYPRNLAVFNDSTDRWESRAQRLGAASDNLLGDTPSAGTPFKLFEAQVNEDKSMHRFRQGQIAIFMDEIYRDWILPHIGKEIVADHSFLIDLSGEEMQQVSEQIAENWANRTRNEQVLSGEIPEDKEVLKQKAIEGFTKGGNRKFIEILKEEMTEVPLGVMTNIAGKQKNLALMTDKIVNMIRQYFATPEIRQDPEMTKLLNIALESSGMSPIMFSAKPQPMAPQMQPNQMGKMGGLNQLMPTPATV